jgi:sodium transport system permease protein
MLNVLIVMRKELIDHLRDTRALASTGLYVLMGPAIVWLVILASPGDLDDSGGAAFGVMAAVFTLASAFSSGSSVSIDMIAGERERRSLLPLLLNGVSRTEIAVGKWLATAVFALCGVLLTLLAFVAVFAFSPGIPSVAIAAATLAPSLLFLALFAAAVQLVVSTWCRNVKEANTYLTILIFVVIAVGMWLAFSPESAQTWWFFVPIAGHQRLLQIGLLGANVPVGESAILAAVSIVATVFALMFAARLFQRDAIVYGE